MNLGFRIYQEYSREDINKAGKLLGDVIPAESDTEIAAEAFRIAYNWRDAHLLPMTAVRYELIGLLKRSRAKAVTAARPKRMASIRRKLSTRHRSTLKLSQIQDLAGCRAICKTEEDLSKILLAYNSGQSKHAFKHIDYVTSPRLSGYRGHHLVVKFNDERFPEFKDFKVEVQVRSRLQHAWATAVEAVGLLTNENLKAGEGNTDWLKLFQLMGSQIADLEGFPIVPGTSVSAVVRERQLKRLDEKLNAVSMLRVAHDGLKKAEEYVGDSTREYYVLRYNSENNTVSVGGVPTIAKGLELEHNSETSEGKVTSVFVQVDKVQNLKAAYPNYFMDVSDFTDLLENATGKAGAPPVESESVKIDWFSEFQAKRKRDKG
ncbi:RelA/SpoT domain-containing protein [Ascidiaceihabitans sp.]|uniref:RelA/SpoT domain-containing protein n=1 Tax=Ascidiaceihabitans sp. TaxID=1872644 RepID=UPI003297FFAC